MSFNDLVKQFDRMLRSQAFAYTRSQELADDLMQETYYRAFKSYDKFDGACPRAWLFTILRNAYINDYRKSQRTLQAVNFSVLEERLEDSTMADFIPSGEHLVFEDTFSDETEIALEGLLNIHREPVLLCDVEGLTYEEIAERLQIPIGTVRSRIFRGRRSLQQKLRKKEVAY